MEYLWFVKTVMFTRVTGIFNMTGNLQDSTSYHTNFVDFRFRKSSDSVISNKISGGMYEIWQQLVTPWEPLCKWYHSIPDHHTRRAKEVI